MVGLEPSTAKAPRSEIRDSKLTNYETGIHENGLSETDFCSAGSILLVPDSVTVSG